MEQAAPVRGTVGVRQLKDGLSTYLARIKAGEELTVTEHGRPIATLRPVGPEVDRMAALVAAGVIRPPRTAARRLPEERVRLADDGSLAGEVSAQRG